MKKGEICKGMEVCGCINKERETIHAKYKTKQNKKKKDSQHHDLIIHLLFIKGGLVWIIVKGSL
jgi:hypothetical protein